MNEKIETTVKRVQESPSSVFTKEDVLSLIKSLEAPAEAKEVNPEKKDSSPREVAGKMLEELKGRILEKFRDELDDSMESDLVDFDSAEFSLFDRRIELDSIEVNKDAIVETLESVLSDLVIDEEG
jgi:hypothetical protein